MHIITSTTLSSVVWIRVDLVGRLLFFLFVVALFRRNRGGVTTTTATDQVRGQAEVSGSPRRSQLQKGFPREK